ncbi:Tautomerase/MIF [Mycena epipterygia]|nr:Tautomerase/MIF [Mycena epipterygia]
MPIFELTTNVKVADPKAFSLVLNKAAIAALAVALGPGIVDEYMTVSYTYNETVTFAGTHDPAFVLHVSSGAETEKNEAMSKILFVHLEEALGAPSDRGYILFNNSGLINVGHKGTTFANLFNTK